METFLSTICGEQFVKKYAAALKENGVDCVDDLRFLVPEDFKEMGFLLGHRRKILKKVSDLGASSNTKTRTELEIKGNTEENVELSEKNKKTLQKLEEDLSILLTNERLLELTAFVRSGKDNGITFAALKILHDQIGLIKRFLKNLVKPENHTFLSHVQKDSADLCHLLYVELKKVGINVWYDMKAGRLDAWGMVEGIATAKYFTIIMTSDYFNRPWPIFEIIVAEILKKPILVLMELDKRHGGLSIETFSATLPKPWIKLLDHELLIVKRRGAFWDATISELMNRLLKKPGGLIADVEKKTESSVLSNQKMKKTKVRLMKIKTTGKDSLSTTQQSTSYDERAAAELCQLSYYHGHLPSRFEQKKVLSKKPPGSFFMSWSVNDESLFLVHKASEGKVEEVKIEKIITAGRTLSYFCENPRVSSFSIENLVTKKLWKPLGLTKAVRRHGRIEMRKDELKICARGVVLYDYLAQVKGELTLNKGAEIVIIKQSDAEGWWTGMIGERTGLFPSTYIEVIKQTVEEVKIAQKDKPKLPKWNPKSKAPKGGDIYVAKWDYEQVGSEELSFKKGDQIVLQTFDDSGWWLGRLKTNRKLGWFSPAWVEKFEG